ncbi:MAG: rhodanese-like domain-containing protein [Algoriphagus sp.]|nr:rhodanese-like domain-containing protein [Algoriphagus sp.]
MKTTLLSGLLILSGLYACQPSSTTQSTTTESTTHQSAASVVTLSAQDFATKSKAGTVVDVRTAGEVAQGKIEGAVEIDFYSADFLDQVKQIAKDQEVYLYCAVGARSEEAARMLIQQGYTKVYHLQGGIQGWSQEGFPVVQ